MYSNKIYKVHFEWDENKNRINIKKHGVSFEAAQYAFADLNRIIAEDVKHSTKKEKRYFCYGKINDLVVTVRFPYRKNEIRIIGAGYWREGKQVYEYEKKNKI